MLRRDYVTAYVQSSQVAGMDGFHWQNVEITRQELTHAFKEIQRRYPVDPGNVLIGGFSSGGFGTLITAFQNVLPVCGFIVLCPEVPDTINDEELEAAWTRGLRGAFLTPEMDRRLKNQEAFVSRCTKKNIPVLFHITPNTGHWYPDDLETRIDQSLRHILK
jgi:dipeptidyl aminopeptidase/acylaminoacyl peptidase